MKDEQAPLTVKSILVALYGSQTEASKELKVRPSAISNWVSWGYFPERLLGRLASDAQKKSLPFSFDEIAALRERAAGEAA